MAPHSGHEKRTTGAVVSERDGAEGRPAGAPSASPGEAAHARASAQGAVDFGARLLAWYRAAARALPWRVAGPADPYAVWLSEVMLQQTRVDTVVPYYRRFLERFPTVRALAEAPEADVLAGWSGLGYYRRARMLHKGAREVHARGRFPSTRAELLEVSGIGPYTAAAVASIAYGEPAELVDGNVARVFARYFALTCDVKSARGSAEVWAVARRELRRDEPGTWNQALMELGATVCTPARPRCGDCPLAGSCAALARGLVDELPLSAKKPPPRLEFRVALVATRTRRAERQVLLAERAPDLRFGGLWEPPSVLAATAAVGGAALATLLATPLGVARDCGIVVHVLSHRRLNVRVLAASCARTPRAAGDYTRFAWVPWDEPAGQRGVSALARKILATAARP